MNRQVVRAAQPARAVLYGRVSVEIEGSKSVDDQLAELRGWADRVGWSVVAEHRDDGASASRYARRTLHRDGWQQVMDLISADAVDVLVVWELSRASRDRAVWAALLAACEQHGVKIAAGGKVHDPEDADDAFVIDLGAALAAREAAVTSKRIRRAVRARAAEGAPHGKLPYGYRSEFDPDTGKPVRRVPDETTAPIVQECLRRVLAGDALYAIAADLRARGLRSPRGADWRPEQVRRLAISPTYAGLRTHLGEVVGTAVWEPLVSLGDHRAAVAKLTDPRRRSWVDGSVKHLLVGIATCGVCGAPCRRIQNRNTPSYACGAGFHVARVQSKVDDLVVRVIIARLSRPDALKVFTVGGDSAATAAAAEEARELRARLEGFYDAAAAGDLTPTGLARIEAGLLPKIRDAEGRAQPQGLPPGLAGLAGPDVAERWASLGVPARREIVRTLLRVRLLSVGGRAYRRFDPDSVAIEWRH